MTQNKEPTVLHFVQTVGDKLWYQNDRTPKEDSTIQKKIAFGTIDILLFVLFWASYVQNKNF